MAVDSVFSKSPEGVGRRDFVATGLAFAASVAAGAPQGADGRFEALQREIDAVSAPAFKDYLTSGDRQGLAALTRLDAVVDRVAAEVKAADVREHPAVWLVYNMGIVVKTAACCFSIDLMHRRGHELAPLLDFAMITHTHSDHYTQAFYEAMDRSGKTVFSNFADNYGAFRGPNKRGGYARSAKEYDIRDVRIRTGFTDHNDYLADFTTTFEIAVGNWRLFHSGDCYNVAKLNPAASPDLWVVHPRCGMDVVEGFEKFRPKTTVVAHLNELGHARNRWRWSWQDGLDVKAKVEAAGARAVVPLWGERI